MQIIVHCNSFPHFTSTDLNLLKPGSCNAAAEQ